MGGDHIVDAIDVDNSIERNKVRIEVIFDSGGIFACLKHGEFFAVIFLCAVLFLSPGVFSLA